MSGCDHQEEEFFLHDCDSNGSKGPGVHALIIGTSSYPARKKWRLLPTGQKFSDIEGSAVAAARFAEFMSNFKDPGSVPVRTIRLLLSPTNAELDFFAESGFLSRNSWRSASSQNVVAALDDWYGDCDKHADNIAVMYVAGHGILVRDEAANVFLQGANQVLDPFNESINLVVIRDAMRYCRAVSNIYIFDCCAIKDLSLESHAGLTLPVYTDRLESRKYDLRIAGACAGTAAYAINAREGTLLSYALVPLLHTAGEVIDNYFAITRSRLDERLPQALKSHRLHPKVGGQEPRVRGEHPHAGIHRPTPPPEYQVIVRLENHPDRSSQPRISIRTKRDQLNIIEDVELRTGEGITCKLAAGAYELCTKSVRAEGLIVARHPLAVDRSMVVSISDTELVVSQ